MRPHHSADLSLADVPTEGTDSLSPLLTGLNKAQQEAVAAPPGPTLVLAGAGSGKTRVLVHRIAWLVEEQGLFPSAVLVVTFTNKAAREVRGRIAQLLSTPLGGMWVGTFHSLCHRLLRSHWQQAGLPQTFQVMDSEDQLRQVRRIMRELAIDEAHYPPRQVASFINSNKDEGRRATSLQPSAHSRYEKTMIQLYGAYEQSCERSGLVDFAELLLRAHELLRDSSPLLAHYQGRFQHLLVDEFQDTNHLQYAWLRLLAGQDGNLFVVGDDDQSIYGWRGARVENIQLFSRDFPGTRTFRLEQNYRSTATILAAANHLISHNQERLGKQLWTTGQAGEPLKVYAALTDRDEAHFVVERITDWVAQGGRTGECAILYRSNAQSRLFEQELARLGVPYRVYGGMRFYERTEIKDVLGYLRLIAHRHDDGAFERVVNTPARALGDRSLEVVRGVARERKISLWLASQAALAEKLLPARAGNALQGFLTLVDGLATEAVVYPLDVLVEILLQRIPLVEHYRREDKLAAVGREENLAELINAAREQGGDDQTPEQWLLQFLTEAVLDAGDTGGDEEAGAVQLMTLHTAKGLEFPLVFMVGLEEGLFPNGRSMDTIAGLEEERRLCYVGMTRAERQLMLSYAEERRLHGSYTLATPSRFLRELPTQLVQEVRLRGTVTRPVAPVYRETTTTPPSPSAARGFRPGQRVRHPKFGEGLVIRMEGEGPRARVEVQFPTHGRKELVLGYAKLESF